MLASIPQIRRVQQFQCKFDSYNEQDANVKIGGWIWSFVANIRKRLDNNATYSLEKAKKMKEEENRINNKEEARRAAI